MKDQICIVTGATSGIGRATAQGLAQQGATVVIVGRDRDRAAATVDHIRRETGNPAVEFMLADLSAQDQVRRLAGQIQDRYERLHILVNNAGCFYRKRRLSADGIEMTWAVNLLSPFLLTNLLLDTLKAGAPARIVNVSSDMQRMARLDFEDLEAERRYSGMRAYGQSKLALLLFTYELARRLEGTGVTANAVHPGFVDTNIGQDYGWPYQLVRPLLKFWALSPEEGAQTSLHVASSPELADVSGKYFKDNEPAPSAPVSYDSAAARRLWQICVQMTGLAAPDLNGDIPPTVPGALPAED
jgi:NAD(P)-dependent dehydrogenase (short-subunit alcohol dehydrogenase family)